MRILKFIAYSVVRHAAFVGYDELEAVDDCMDRRIAHFDLDAFYVAVERVENPKLINVPVLVGWPGARGVVATASYEARQYGCHSAQAMRQALQKCPEAIVISPNMTKYREYSDAFHEILLERTPLVEPAGLDEAYVDLSVLAANGLGEPISVAQELRQTVLNSLGLTVSVCIAGSKPTAKIGSAYVKPDGCLEIPIGTDAAFLSTLPVRTMPSVGPKFQRALLEMGINTIGELADTDSKWLEMRFGRQGLLTKKRAQAKDTSVIRHLPGQRKSISRESTFSEDLSMATDILAQLFKLSEAISNDLRDSRRAIRTISVKIRWSDFEVITRQRTLEHSVHSHKQVHPVAKDLLETELKINRSRGVRLLGIGLSNFTDEQFQLPLVSGPTERVIRDKSIETAIQKIHGKFGSDAIRRGH
ncbi:MAG: DNA polymerase IV [Dehalococcoidia bacterium]|nr:DNA polymerase IV [Dehalococcoidia bacterium]